VALKQLWLSCSPRSDFDTELGPPQITGARTTARLLLSIKARNPLLFGSPELSTHGKVAGGENFVVGVTSDGHLDARKRDTATAKCTGFLGADAASRLLQSPA
jgi:hypothetical protein